jgi:signal transduction histidine kinase
MTTRGTDARRVERVEAALNARERVRRITPWQADAALAAMLGLLAQAEVWLTAAGEGQRVATSLTAAAMCAALAWRRRAPLAAALAVVAAVGVLGTVEELPTAVFLLPVTLVALYSLGAYDSGSRAAVGLAAALVVLGYTTARDSDATVTDLTAPALLFTAAWAAGRVIRSRGAQTATLERHAAKLQAEQDERERAAAAAERVRIARELHDIVAHRVSTIVIQSDSGLATADEPERSRQAFTAIGESGRQALAELRRLLGLLRADGETTGVQPQPGLARVRAVIDEVERAGLQVDAQIDEPPMPLPPGLDLTAYRVVQEGLTNALRHGDGEAWLSVRQAGQTLRVDVRNRRSGGPPAVSGAGQGLAGMRERVRLFGGELSAAEAGDEFVLAVRLPIEPQRQPQ